MPEYPDVTVYLDCLRPRIIDEPIEQVRIQSPFVLRTVDPPIFDIEGKSITGLSRIGKRIVFELPDELYVVIHLMVAGRLRWRERGTALPKKLGLAAFDFPSGSLFLTEAGTKKRASISVVRGDESLARIDRGGIEVFESSQAVFREALLRENHTLKRSLTDPRFFSGIGNAYSDEILHHARLSPIKQTKRLNDEEIIRLYTSTLHVLQLWTDRLAAEVGDGFPEKVTAFRAEMAVHGKYRQPCPDCGAPVQRIQYASNETNYCARCQNGGKLLADRSLSRLLKGDWPKTIEELEEGDGV